LSKKETIRRNMDLNAALFCPKPTQPMAQTLRKNFSPAPHSTARHTLIVRANPIQSLEGLLVAMQGFLEKAKSDLLQPRPQAVNRILLEAASLH
jgi:hypothetical protein